MSAAAWSESWRSPAATRMSFATWCSTKVGAAVWQNAVSDRRILAGRVRSRFLHALVVLFGDALRLRGSEHLRLAEPTRPADQRMHEHRAEDDRDAGVEHRRQFALLAEQQDCQHDRVDRFE